MEFVFHAVNDNRVAGIGTTGDAGTDVVVAGGE